MRYVLGVDIGGTFTDCVAVDEDGAVSLGKALSTPDDFAIGAIDAVRDAARNIGLRDEEDSFGRRDFFSTPVPSATTRSLRARARRPRS